MGGTAEAASTQATSTMPAPPHLVAANKGGGPQPPTAAGQLAQEGATFISSEGVVTTE